MLLKKVGEAERRKHGAVIFERIANYLRLLAAKTLFPRGNLLEQIIVRIEEGTGNLTGIQLVAKFLSKKPQKMEQLKELTEFLFQNVALPVSGNTLDFYFPSSNTGIQGITDINQLAMTVQSINDINLEQNPGKIFICGGKVLSTQEIFEAKHKHL